MSGAHEDLERAQHAAHGGSHSATHSGGNKLIGLTMALLGVLIAFCAALVGDERNELTRTMIEQAEANSDFAGASTKFRLIMIELEKELIAHKGSAGAEAAAPETQLSRAVVERFLQLYLDYSKTRRLTNEWSASYRPLIDAHFRAAEGYEWAQLIAEIGIVIASLAVLLTSRPAWFVSIALGVLCLGQLGRVFVRTGHEVRESLARVEHTSRVYDKLRSAQMLGTEDEKIVEQLDPGGKLRALAEAAEAPTTPGGASAKPQP